MSILDYKDGSVNLLMGNEAIARGAVEAGVKVAAGYPGTPSSEIIENLAKVAEKAGLYVEWSVNEKVSLEVAAAGSFAGLRSMCVMKQNGVNVASDFLLHLGLSGTRGGMVLVPCDDPGAISSVNEGESRLFARLIEVPLIEPGSFQEAIDMIKWAFELSEKIHNVVMVRSVTRLSHASGNVKVGTITKSDAAPLFKFDGNLLDALGGPVITAPVPMKHRQQQEKLKTVAEIFETSEFNKYTGPENPELLIITSSACSLYSLEAVDVLGLDNRVGVLKLGTTYPLPEKLVKKHVASAKKILFVEEVQPFLEDLTKICAAAWEDVSGKKYHGKYDGSIPTVNELNPDIVIAAITKILGIDYRPVPEDYEKKGTILSFTGAPNREVTFCPGCQHRASYWSIHNVLTMQGKGGFVCGDIGCYTIGILGAGFNTLKTTHSMGSGLGIASGFGKLKGLGMKQDAAAVCGDSTFFHSVIPALVNAVHVKSDMMLIVFDNKGTAMTGFQPHPGTEIDAMGAEVNALNIESICRAIGAEVHVCDPFEISETEDKLLDLIENGKGTRVLILKQSCALSPEKRNKKRFEMSVDESLCRGETCGCERFCTKIFRCPGLVWNRDKNAAMIDSVICTGCGVCKNICPAGAIKSKEVKA
ncbi:MAG: thiamine pyrophosphate-dependent enzyme [Leptospirales bacterium]|nr:thiamine pyrophosphate-dependent enzyme [Leptospirales bacterium]